MTALAAQVRGWCPGALRPMESGDGLIVRIRPRCGALAIADLRVIADIAARTGNGLIDLTRRANVQVRGLKPERLPGLWADLSERGLIDDSAEAEAVRNVMLSPLAGLDSSEMADVRTVARQIEHALVTDPALQRLPAKFSFIVDGGGLLPLDAERADIRLRAVRDGIALGVDRPDGVAWLGSAMPDAAAAVAVRTAQAFLALRPDTRVRLRDLSASALAELQARLAPHLAPLTSSPARQDAKRLLGEVACKGRVVAAGFAAPFGRVEAGNLCALADAAARLDIAEFRLSPWRALYAPVNDAQIAHALLEAASACGFITNANDPLALIDACPGAPGCRSTSLDTRAAARALAPLLAAMGCRSGHISGCAKGCARSRPADLVLVGAGDRFGLLRNDTAQGTAHVFVPPERLGDLPRILETL
jgi:precorrin-3B synthase